MDKTSLKIDRYLGNDYMIWKRHYKGMCTKIPADDPCQGLFRNQSAISVSATRNSRSFSSTGNSRSFALLTDRLTFVNFSSPDPKHLYLKPMEGINVSNAIQSYQDNRWVITEGYML